MALAFKIEPIPLVSGADGVVRVQGTRVTLDTLASAFNEGLTAEEIVHRYPSVSLEDAYAVITYYLRHRTDVGRYLEGRQREAAQIRAENEERFPPRGIRERLLARRAQKDDSRDAPASG